MINELLQRIENSPTAFHAAREIKSTLLSAGFSELSESESWSLEKGGSYFTVRGDSSVVAFQIPKTSVQGYQIAAAHLDSPAFRLKPNAVLTGAYLRLATERYGGMQLESFLDRPLSLAGRVCFRENERILSRLFDLGDRSFVIPSVAMHLSRTSEKTALAPHIDMNLLYGEAGDENTLLSDIAESIGCKSEDILSHDTYLYVRESGKTAGRKGEYILSPRLDDLMCVYPLLTGFLKASEAPKALPVLALFDREEVGSGSPAGAESDLLPSILSRISSALGIEHAVALRKSFLLSADNAHALHPNRPELSDKENAPLLNGGIVIKENANGRYITDSVSFAYVAALCQACRVPTQAYANRSDIPGGSTLGNLLQRHLSVAGADIGLAQLAMHAAVETAGARDVAYLETLAACFFSEAFSPEKDGSISL